ncbi:anthrone oxygenase family protein [Streptomyces hoynatensis]|uniref:DUF1772 domain-containing protein n=1 Tax=Streptomyces hoynatensis TaxID=1141874 RepID=A0A3A9YTB4_9ACTN|nr:anthrone oxygenase family protein [Streptomyces hoynatensis]RKN38516.1 DUF1772 domain-containing protein [Streptomyces hoynatensis]
MTFLAVLAAAATLLTSAAMTGVFFSFSTSVMPGLDALEPGGSVRAMQSMNEKILNPLFLTAFTAAPLAAVAAGVLLLLLGHGAAGLLFLAAAAVYLLGVLLPTAAVNVPMNEALAALAPPDAVGAWAGYRGRWTRWNSLRAACGAATVLLAGLGLYLWGRATAHG